jgi:hypothetical protein
MSDINNALDVPLWGAAAIADAANIDRRKAFYLLERGLLPATKVGKQWTSTRRRILSVFAGEAA